MEPDRHHTESQQLGFLGETTAVQYLQEKGYTVMLRNVRLGHEEIDIIAHDPRDDVLVFVEVKTRTQPSRPGFHPEWTAGRSKRMALRRAMRRWVADHDYHGGYRIDLVCVEAGQVTHHFIEIGIS